MRLQRLAPADGGLPTPARALPGAIRFYRAHLSGRGPLRRVRCTFERTESCSAYGLRVAQEQSTFRGLVLIARRMRRCGCLSLYRDRDRGVWLWHAEHELQTAVDLDGALERSRELPSTRAAVLRANALVGRELGDRDRVEACRELLARLGDTHPAGAPAEQVLVRAAATCFAKARRRWRTRVAAALLIALPIVATLLIHGAMLAATAVALGAATLIARSSLRCSRELSRAEGLLASGAFEPPERQLSRVSQI